MSVVPRELSPMNTDVAGSVGGMAARVRAFDFSTTPLGPAESWPQSLQTVVRILLTSRYAMWMGWGPEMTFLYNDAYAPTLGIKQEWALGAPAKKVWAEIWPDIGPRIERVLATGQATWDEALMLFLERSGYTEETYHTFSYSPLSDDAGRISGMLCVVTEETERVVGERRLAVLRELASRLSVTNTEREVFAAAAECLSGACQDLPFTLTYLCPPGATSARLVSTSGGVAAGSPAAPESIDLTDRDAPWPVTEVIEGGLPLDLDELPRRFAQLPRGPWPKSPERAIVLPLPQQGQSTPGGVFIAGYNPYRPLDTGCRSFVSLLVGQIAARLANAQAYEAERRRAEALAEIDRAKTTFFSNVSHEFRTPLTLMLGPLQDAIAHESALPPPVAEELAVVHRNGLRLLKLVNTLLDFSRIEAGRVQASYEPTDLPRYTAELASVFRSAIEKAGLTLKIDAPPMAEPAYVDRDMWEKVVLNLISNAFKFTLDGEIVVGLHREGNLIRLTVRDTGSGIPAAELPRLFERFHRVEGTKGRTHEGTGIGLALVQELVKLHGGTVTVESDAGQGSTFSVTIPAGKDHLPPERISAGRTLSSTALGANPFVEEAMHWLPDGGGATGDAAIDETDESESREPAGLRPETARRERIIIADDNADMRDYLRRLLSSEYDVEVVADGVRAVEAAQRRPPALILSDVMMPRLDGFGLIARLRQDAGLAAIPVILLSARAGEEATLEGIKAGADDYLIKPFSARELRTRVAAQIDRKRFERQLASAEQRLQSALAAAKMAVWEWDPARDAVTASTNLAEVFGLPPGETLASRNAGFRLVHPEDVDRHRAILEAAGARREGFHSEFRIIRPRDGKVAWLEERSHAATEERTGEARLIGLVVDVTDRKEAEQAIQRSEARARFLVELDDALRGLADPDEMSRTAARLLAQHFHCDRALYVEVAADEDHCEVTGEYSPRLSSIAGPYRISQYGADYIATVRADRPYVEHDATRPTMSAVERAQFAALQIGSFISAPLFKGHKLVAMFVVHDEAPRRWRDDEIEEVTLVANRCWESIERARVSQALAKSEERLALGVEAGELGTFYCPMPMGPIVWNEKCKEHFWLPPAAEITFDVFYSILHPEDRERTRQAVERAVYGHEPYDIQYRTVAPDGRQRWVRAKGRAYYDATGRPTRFDGVTLDITELKQAERRREQTLAAERAAREEAERVSRMKDEFLATLSHELRTPLNAILGWAQILNRGPQDADDLSQGLDAIERNARSQTQMIEDLLDMSRIISGKIRLDVQRVALAEVVEQAIQSVKPAAEAKGVRLTKVIDPYAGPVSGDVGRLQQVIWNLLTNAIKFTSRDGQVQVVLERVNSHVEVSVADTGDGIEPEFLPHVFERFRQADGSTTRRHGGLGLGLSIVKQLAELHGGTVQAKSPGKGKGSTFTLVLPVAAATQMAVAAGTEDPREHPRSASRASEGVANEMPNLKGLGVLVVDDDADARELMRRILCEHGAEVTLAASAPAAMTLLRASRFDLIVSDIGMPQEDGYELMQKVRALPTERGGHTPAVALTAFARSQDRQRALRAGYQMHVAKPVEPSEFVTVCASLTGRVR